MSVPKECVYGIPNSSAKQCDWLAHARPSPFPFPFFLFPDGDIFVILLELSGARCYPCGDIPGTARFAGSRVKPMPGHKGNNY